MLRHASVKKATDLNRYRFNLIRYTDAKPNLHKPNAITEGRLTVLKTDVKAQGELRQTLKSFYYSLPDSIVSALEGAINALTKKYSVMMLDVESEIEQSEREFADLINELEGDEFDMLSLLGIEWQSLMQSSNTRVYGVPFLLIQAITKSVSVI